MNRQTKRVIKKFGSWYFSIKSLPYWCISIMDFMVIFVSMAFMYCLVYGPSKLVANGYQMLWTLLIDMIFYLIGMKLFHTYTDVFRVLSFKDLARTACATFLGSVLCMAFRWAIDMIPYTSSVPYRVFVLTFVCSTVVLWIMRIIVRNLHDISRENVREELELLPRQEIEVDMEKIGELIHGKCVLITGAAGSIGSEITRQIAAFRPSKLILVDQAETPMHDLMLEMKSNMEFLDIKFVVASIINQGRMTKIFSKYKPDYVFHAAAYKHVPMMEDNPSISVQNNVFGTRILADLAVRNHVKKFVMVSTDKAVNPTNVMGCSKRLCEIYVQSLNTHLEKMEGEHTQFITTRFGNVLGSNGSVIPLFKKQIEKGGPVTVTHPDILRYFMLIPEACKLVLEAGTMGNGGEVFVFDMGEPVKIADLAKKMIHNSGKRNIEIKYTGLREGEKLYEEVLFKGEEERETSHQKIRVAKVKEYEYDYVCQQFERLKEVTQTYDEMAIVKQMKVIVPEFKSNNSKYEILDHETDEGYKV
ncbi:MAG: polysaccharide biosynthesis protein [Bacteroidaceae bacterium]|nr:polysaccharide biosynthesis protein [Bacteroidaceae bacterium]